MQLAALAGADLRLQRRIDLTVGQEIRVPIPEGQQSHASDDTRYGMARQLRWEFAPPTSEQAGRGDSPGDGRR